MGTAMFIGNVEGFEEHESVEPVSVSLGFQTVESVADIIEMNSQIKRVRFDVDDDDDDDEHGDSNDVQMREELQDLLDAQQSGTVFILGDLHVTFCPSLESSPM
ncbi:hypothetical protein L2E82_29358 [Cichorium intybus]|uniref:Uncharacterized protein n=1 Tax=Cichorium intybus TaxID=13427 RepID=A0ACB9CXF5_CICIN|nr:hypothetical protein L2E82_29358 [Cichorium intybus]